MAANENTGLLEDREAPGGAQLTDEIDAKIRHAFVQKVYGILGFQLILTTVLGGIVMTWGQESTITSPALFAFLTVFSIAVTIGIMCVFMCNPETMRRSPTNYILLFVFTTAQSVLVGIICVQYTKESVLVGLSITALVVLALTIFSFQTACDFSGMGPYLMVGLMVMCGLGFALSFASICGWKGQAFSAVRMAFAACGALLFSFYIVYDTQLIVGGKHQKFRFSIDDYAFAAITLYMDIINLFIYMMELLGTRR